MRSSGLIELDAVLAVARHRGFRAAATELGMSRSALSHAIAALEAKLGVRLFHRTTRSVSLTETGEQFVSGVAPAVGQIRDAMERAGSHRATPAGTLRINTSAGAARQMEPIIFAYLRRYPDMTVDIVTEGRLLDIVAEGFDAGVRLAELVPQDMISVPLGPHQRFAVVGSPNPISSAARSRARLPISPGIAASAVDCRAEASIVGSSSATAKRWRLMVTVR
jgi:DNA-binding transcriptional LysR family regulator